MGEKAVLYCRGCLSEVDGSDSYFFVLKKVRDLFTGCTAIQILPEEDECFPQQLCSACYEKCREWWSFKEMCQKVDKRLQRKAIESVPIQGDEVPTIRIKEEVMDVDESCYVESFIVGEVFKKEEEDEEDEKSEEETIENLEGEKCPVCDVNIPHPRSLKEHLKEHYSVETPKCPICDQQFTRSSKVYSHIMSLHMGGDEGEQSDMPKCQESQWKRTKVVAKEVHVECPKCQNLFESITHLQRHFVVHTDELPYICNYCKYANRHKKNVNRHIRLAHPEKSVEGGVSVKEDSIFRSARPWEAMGYLELTRRHRDAPQSHVCKVCAKGFASQIHLLKHSVVHTREKPFQCVYCLKEFSTKRGSVSHVKILHPGKPLADAVVLIKGTKYANEYAKAVDKRR